jgi:hypothetical protein
MESESAQSSLRLQNLLPQDACQCCSPIRACVWIFLLPLCFTVNIYTTFFDVSKRVLYSIATQLEYVGSLNLFDVIVLKCNNCKAPQYAGLLVLNFRARLQNCKNQLLASPCLPVCLSVRIEQLCSQWRIFWWNLVFWVFFEKLSRKFEFHYILTRIAWILQEVVCKFVISCSILVTMRNFSDKICREYQNTFYFQ